MVAKIFRSYLVVCAAVVSVALPVRGAGLGIFEQGAKAMGMAGAFTAQADDPSALFHNVGGLAFLNQRAFQTGLTAISVSASEFQGAAPFPGPGVIERSEPLLSAPPHFYWVEPLGATENWTFGLAVNSPFGLSTKWNDPEFSGRFLSVKGSLELFDINPNLGWRVSPKVGVGFGLVARFSQVELVRNLPQVNPFTARAEDIARVTLESDLDSGLGFQLGVLVRASPRFSWGLSYRSRIKTDYSGDGRFVQIPTGSPEFDALVAASLPFDRSLPISTTIELPAQASFGVGVAISPEWLVELDVNWSGWSSFDEVVVDFKGALPPIRIGQGWKDAHNYRLGFELTTSKGTQWRFGGLFDETPQPLETIGPLLPDGDRRGVSLGYGFRGPRVGIDLAVTYLAAEERLTLVNDSGYNGSYESSGLLSAATFSW